MALIHIGFFSHALQMCTSCDVILPLNRSNPSQPRRTLYLLHNFGGGRTSWQRMTCIERYACARGLAVVMPEAGLSSYADMAHGGHYLRYIADELPKVMRGFFPLSCRREDTFIAGCSMGGYGALRIALHRPERFAAAGSLSSGHTCFPDFICQKDDRGVSMAELTFGPDGISDDDDDLNRRARSLAANGETAPRIFIECGAQDPLLLDNCRISRDFFGGFKGNPFDFAYSEPDGAHDWAFWDAHICDFLDYALQAEVKP